MGFANEILGGASKLIRAAIQSPNFVHGVSGWSINKNGSAEFNSITIPPGTGGATVYIQATAPATAHTGDLWFNTSAGYQIAQWDGAEWIPFQFGSGSLGSGSIVAGLIAAGAIDGMTINAITVNGNTISAANVLISGATGGLFTYSSGGQIVTILTSGTWKAPAGVTTIKCEAWAPGGGGSGGQGTADGGSGGGGGEYAAENNLAVTAGNTYTPTYGAVGVGGTAGNPGTAGGNMVFPGDSVTVTAHGGSGATAGIPGAGGTGSTNSVHNNGGSGASGGVQPANAGGGGGGGSGGPGNPGNNGTAGVLGTYGPGAAALANGGPGGDGGRPFTLPHVGSVPSVGPGGGGGGGSVSGSNPQAAGNSQVGWFKLTYTSSAPTLLSSIAGMSGTDPIASTAYPEGAKLDHLEVVNAVRHDNIATPAAIAGAALLYGASGQPAYVNPAGLQMNLEGAQLATFPGITATTVALTTIATANIPANDAEIGAVYRLEVWGNGTWGSTVQALQLAVTLGGTVMANPTIGNSWFALSTTFRFRFVGKVICVTTGATGTWVSNLHGELSVFGANALPTAGSQASGAFTASESTGTTTKDTTVTESLAIQAGWAATTGAPTLTSRVAQFKRVA